MAHWSRFSEVVKRLVRRLVNSSWETNDDYHQQPTGDNDCIRVLGGVKVLHLAVAYTLAPEMFTVGQPDDFTCNRFTAVKFREDGRRFHVPRPKWSEALSCPLVQKWFTL